MGEKNDALQGQSSEDSGSLLNESSSMSVEVGDAIDNRTSLPVRLFRAAVAGLAITGIGYYALASSPELNKSFSQLTGLSVIDQVAASGGCDSSSGAYPEDECGSKGCGMVPYADDAMSVSLDAGEGSCCASSMMVGAASETACPDMGGECCVEGAEECAGSCPFASAQAGEVLASEATSTDSAEVPTSESVVVDQTVVSEEAVAETAVAEVNE